MSKDEAYDAIVRKEWDKPDEPAIAYCHTHGFIEGQRRKGIEIPETTVGEKRYITRYIKSNFRCCAGYPNIRVIAPILKDFPVAALKEVCRKITELSPKSRYWCEDPTSRGSSELSSNCILEQ